MKSLRFGSAVLACIIACTGCASTARDMHHSYWSGKESYEELFRTTAAKKAKRIDEPVLGMILPHHLFVGHEIAAAYNAVAKQKPSIVVVIGPNHYSHGHGEIQTTDRAFATPYGSLEPATAVIDALTESGITTIEPMTFETEHAITTHVAFVKKIFPTATIVPLVLAVGGNEDRIDALSDALDDILPEDALVIASVDFSHYMRPEVAAFHDGYSRAAIEQFSLDDVRRLEIDSPESIRTLLRYLTLRGAQNIVYKKHTNSADFTGGAAPTETTSHFFMAFGKGEPLAGPFATVQFVGDTIVGRGIAQMIDKGIDPLARIRGTEDRFFRGMTVSALNLEGPISDATPNAKKAVSFAFGREKTLKILREMSVNVASIANNHIDDAGAKGTHDTIDALDAVGMSHPGFPGPCVSVSIVDGTMAICSFTDTHGFLEVADVAKEIASARTTADYVLVSLHWGVEYADEPTPEQREKAAAIIAAGADAIIGHGPHVAQPLEWINGKPVFYSIGNFLFDQPDPSLSSGIVAGITLAPNGIGATSFPIETVNGLPRLR